MADASDQAILVAAAANLTSESLLASTQAEADKIRDSAQAEDLRLRSLATTELERVRQEDTALVSESAARITSDQLKVSAELARLRAEATHYAASIRTAAEGSCQELISRATSQSEATRRLTQRELDQARSQGAELRSATAAEAASTRDGANAEAERVLGDAAQQLHWTQETIASLLRTAKAEADRLRLAEHEAACIHLATRRGQLRDLISRVCCRLRTDIAEAVAEAKRLRAQARAILEAADKDTLITAERALAQRVITEADLTAEAAAQRGQRRPQTVGAKG